MRNVWIISDTHFDHANILNFKNFDGDYVRPEFSDVDEMNESLIENWNRVVGIYDKVYHLGDIAMGKWENCENILKRLNGKKRLVLGNHDVYSMVNLSRYFDKIMTSWRPTREVIFSHHPLFVGKDDPKIRLNVHGHVHRTRSELSPVHYNVSVEMTNYTPINIDTILAMVK